ncbi:unnamed protein product [Clonostachys solani]|uniref:Peptidase M20 dimerisation domain-containing protein n=1 Tax=Clonostachys solani TaxID=160281 RepID=A0A9N9ZGV3_9HYPO|nr:unnamed protein product [Clonostachys solani]
MMYAQAALLLIALAAAATCDTPSYRSALLELHKNVVEIPSNSGLEAELGSWLYEYFQNKSWSVTTQAVPPVANTPEGDTRINVLASPAGNITQFSPKVILTTHFDTVPPHIGYAIEEGSVTTDTIISGRGSVDAKGSLAAIVIAVDELVKAGKVSPADIAVGLVVGEEAYGDGIEALSDYFIENPTDLSAVIFGEPTETKLACGHKGVLGCTLNAKGVAGHSGYPEVGKSATQFLIHALDEILLADLGTSEEFGNTTVNVGKLAGGEVNNVIAASASAGMTIRVALGPEDGGQKIVKGRLDSIIQEIDSTGLSLDCSEGYGLVELDCEVDGFETAVMKYGTDIPGFKVEGNYSKILYGPGTIFVAHTDYENITVGDLELAVEDYQKLVLNALE